MSTHKRQLDAARKKQKKKTKTVRAEIVVVSKEEQEQRQQQDRTINAKKNFLYALKQSVGMILAACEYAGIAHKTYRRWYQDDAEFREATNDILDNDLQFVRDKLKEQIHKGNIAGIIYYLKCKDPEFRPQMIVANKTLEDFIKEYEQLPDDDDDENTNEPQINKDAVQDTGQTQARSPIHSEHSTEAMAGEAQEEKHNTES